MKRLIRHYFKSHSRLAQFMRFATVGVKVSLIDAGLLYLLHFSFGFNLYLSRFVSLGAAIGAGYLLNRYFTFGGDQRGCFYRQMAGHFGVHLTGGLINYGVFSLVVTIGHRMGLEGFALTLLPLFGLVTGGVIGLLFNFMCSKRFVFQTRVRDAEASS
ncbi:MAG: GtrA family protein [Puniceicoccaceae bacterium]